MYVHRLPVVLSVISSQYGHFITVVLSHPSYLIKSMLGAWHFVIIPWANHQSNCRGCLHVLMAEPLLSALLISKLSGYKLNHGKEIYQLKMRASWSLIS